MTTALKIDLQRKYTEEEREALFIAYADACGRGDHEAAERYLEELPLHPRWAKITLDVMGREYLVENFNLTHANEVFGEGWLDGG